MIGGVGLNDTTSRAYHEYLVDLAVAFGAEKDRAEKEMYDVLQFQVDLANVSVQCSNQVCMIDLTIFLSSGIPIDR